MRDDGTFSDYCLSHQQMDAGDAEADRWWNQCQKQEKEIERLRAALKDCADAAYKEAVDSGFGRCGAQMVYHAVKTEARKALEGE